MALRCPALVPPKNSRFLVADAVLEKAKDSPELQQKVLEIYAEAARASAR